MKKLINKKTIGVIISFIFIAALLTQVNLEKTLQSFALMNPITLLPVIPLFLLSFTFRAVRWKVFLAEPNLKFRALISSIFIGFSLNCILPARAGEIYRAYFFSKKENLNTTRVFTSVILERFFDGFILFIILLGVIYCVHNNDLLFKIASLAGLIFFGGLIFLFLLVYLQKTGNKREKIKCYLMNVSNKTSKFIEKSFRILNSFLDGLKTLKSISILFKTFFLTFLIWGLEGIIMYLIIKSFGVEISYFGALLVLSVTAFSSLIPAGPAAIGPYQWGYVIALSIFNVETELAFAISITNQFIFILLILTIGLYFMLKDHININEKEIESELNWS